MEATIYVWIKGEKSLKERSKVLRSNSMSFKCVYLYSALKNILHRHLHCMSIHTINCCCKEHKSFMSLSRVFIHSLRQLQADQGFELCCGNLISARRAIYILVGWPLMFKVNLSVWPWWGTRGPQTLWLDNHAESRRFYMKYIQKKSQKKQFAFFSLCFC